MHNTYLHMLNIILHFDTIYYYKIVLTRLHLLGVRVPCPLMIYYISI